MDWGEIIGKLLNINPISAVSVMFALIYFFHAKKSMSSLEKIHENAVKEIKAAYSEANILMKDFIENNKIKK